MNTENIPQVGSKWAVNMAGDINAQRLETVSAVRKRGRGYQVVTDVCVYRLRDFLKVAKPA